MDSHEIHNGQEVQKLIGSADFMQLNALYEQDNESESSKDELYLNLKQMHAKRNGYDSSGGSGYNISDKSTDDGIDMNIAMDYDNDSIAMLATFSKDVQTQHYETQETEETPVTKCCGAFWNLFKYISIFLSIFWMLFLFIMLIQPSMRNIRSMISYIDPIASKNHPVGHRINSKQSCFNYDVTKFLQKFNVYLLFHVARWFVYSLIYRNRLILWINSILWELIQFFIASLTVFNLQWIGQCWYDVIIFDILLTNMLGIEFGYILMKKTEICTLYDEFNQIFKCKISFFKSFICIWCGIILFQLQQLLMFIIFDQTFWYDTDGWLIWCRLIIYSLSTLFCINQLFHWIKYTKTYYNEIKSLSWIIILNMLVLSELLISIKTYTAQSHQ